MQVVLFDVQQRSVLAELTVPYVKYVAWSSDMEHVAFLAKHAIVVAKKNLSAACTGGLPHLWCQSEHSRSPGWPGQLSLIELAAHSISKATILSAHRIYRLLCAATIVSI